MKKHLYIYACLVVFFIVYNLFFEPKDQRLAAIVNILLASVLFLYLSYLALLMLRNMKSRSKK